MNIKKKIISNTLCKIGLHSKTSYINYGLVNSVPLSHKITRCKNCKKIL